MKKLVLLAAVLFIDTGFAFSDVDYKHSYSTAINRVKESGIVKGYEDGSFKPANKINRAEFTKIVIGAKYPDELSNCDQGALNFTDIDHSAWFAPYVCVAKDKNIIKGYEDGTFGPAKNIKFTEAAKILAETFGNPQNSSSNVWYERYVKALESESAIPEEIEDFAYEITRGQMAEMIFRLKWKINDKKTKKYNDFLNPVLASKSTQKSNKAPFNDGVSAQVLKIHDVFNFDALVNSKRYTISLIGLDGPKHKYGGGFGECYGSQAKEALDTMLNETPGIKLYFDPEYSPDSEKIYAYVDTKTVEDVGLRLVALGHAHVGDLAHERSKNYENYYKNSKRDGDGLFNSAVCGNIDPRPLNSKVRDDAKKNPHKYNTPEQVVVEEDSGLSDYTIDRIEEGCDKYWPENNRQDLWKMCVKQELEDVLPLLEYESFSQLDKKYHSTLNSYCPEESASPIRMLYTEKLECHKSFVDGFEFLENKNQNFSNLQPFEIEKITNHCDRRVTNDSMAIFNKGVCYKMEFDTLQKLKEEDYASNPVLNKCEDMNFSYSSLRLCLRTKR